MNIILVTGKSEHGKTTVAEHIIERINSRGITTAVKGSFGSYLKFVARTYFGWDGQKDLKGRELLQWLGTDLVRNQMPDFWLDSVRNLALALSPVFKTMVIDDCRFPNELDGFSNTSLFNTISIKVVRPGHVSKLTQEQLNHPSETALDHTICNYTISNDGDIFKLYSIVDSVLYRIERLGFPIS